MALREGDDAPNFSLQASGGEVVSLHGLRGQEVILYFYPKDDTPGCTLEACNFRDAHERITDAHAVVLGISPDDVDAHDRFVAKFGLPFRLLADPDHTVAEDYGVWQQKKFMGKSYMGAARSTFLIDGDGRIKKIWHKVDPHRHLEQVLELVEA